MVSATFALLCFERVETEETPWVSDHGSSWLVAKRPRVWASLSCGSRTYLPGLQGNEVPGVLHRLHIGPQCLGDSRALGEKQLPARGLDIDRTWTWDARENRSEV